MRGAKIATRIQNRMINTPIVAILEPRKPEISFLIRLPSDDIGLSFLGGSCGEEGGGVLSGNDSDMSLI
jgi:hypothetical protein